MQGHSGPVGGAMASQSFWFASLAFSETLSATDACLVHVPASRRAGHQLCSAPLLSLHSPIMQNEMPIYERAHSNVRSNVHVCVVLIKPVAGAIC